MSKLDKIGHYEINEGFEVSREEFDAIQKEDNAKKIKRLFYLLENDPSKLVSDEIIILMKMAKVPSTSPTNIKLDFGDDGYFTCKRNLNMVMELHDYTKAFLYSISHMITHDGRLKYNNNRIIPNVSKLKTYLKISNDKWNSYVKPDIDEFNILTKEKIDNKWCILLNPIFATTTRTFTETMFIAFHSDLKRYLHPLEYLYLKKFYGIEVD